AQAMPRRELSDRGRLADAGRADERDHAAGVERIVLRHAQPAREPEHHLSPCALADRVLDLADERVLEVGIEAEPRDARREHRALGLAEALIGAAQARELAAQE